MTETELMEEIRAACDERGLFVFHAHDSRRCWGRGFPDLCIAGSRVIFREAKGDGGSLSPDQVTWKYKLRAAGQDWAIWRPRDWQSGLIERELDGLR